MKTHQLLITLFACMLLVAPLCAQSTAHKMTDGTVVQFPDLTITGSTLGWSVIYDAARGVYRYTYIVNAPVTNLAPIEAVQIDVSGTTLRPQTDPSLQENIVRRAQLQPATTIPVGITVSDPQWRGGVGAGGRAFFSARKVIYALPPNSSKSGFVIESKLPPGIRSVEITPSDKAWFDIADQLPDNGAEFEQLLDVHGFSIKTITVGPAEISDTALYDGGGQQPAEVNKFLRYAAPLDNRVKVPANSTYTVIVYYGKTIQPATFSATLDGVDITSRFHPIPGGADAVSVAIGASTTKLHMSVDGTKSSGGKSTDSDTLTFLPQ